MNDQPEKQQLWKIYGIIMGVMLGGAALILGAQSAWNSLQQNLAKSASPSPSPTQSLAPTLTDTSPPSQPVASKTLTQQEAVNLINRYLEAKARIFAPPFDRQLAASLTTGSVYNDMVKPGGSIDWLQQNSAYYQYGIREAEATGYFSGTPNEAQVEVFIKENVSFYMNGRFDRANTNSGRYRFNLKLENGTWKIADRRSIDDRE